MKKLEVIEDKIVDITRLSSLLNIWRLQEKSVVFTNGCFDLLHLGHIDYLAKAADLGGKLVIGLNSDDSTRKLKGLGRPITDQRSRSMILASLSFVDAVILFDEPTPLELIKFIMPDVLVKGADYALDQIVGAREVMDKGGQVERIELLQGYSTSLIEKRIKQS